MSPSLSKENKTTVLNGCTSIKNFYSSVSSKSGAGNSKSEAADEDGANSKNSPSVAEESNGDSNEQSDTSHSEDATPSKDDNWFSENDTDDDVADLDSFNNDDDVELTGSSGKVHGQTTFKNNTKLTECSDNDVEALLDEAYDELKTNVNGTSGSIREKSKIACKLEEVTACPVNATEDKYYYDAMGMLRINGSNATNTHSGGPTRNDVKCDNSAAGDETYDAYHATSYSHLLSNASSSTKVRGFFAPPRAVTTDTKNFSAKDPTINQGVIDDINITERSSTNANINDTNSINVEVKPGSGFCSASQLLKKEKLDQRSPNSSRKRKKDSEILDVRKSKLKSVDLFASSTSSHREQKHCELQSRHEKKVNTFDSNASSNEEKRERKCIKRVEKKIVTDIISSHNNEKTVCKNKVENKYKTPEVNKSSLKFVDLFAKNTSSDDDRNDTDIKVTKKNSRMRQPSEGISSVQSVKSIQCKVSRNNDSRLSVKNDAKEISATTALSAKVEGSRTLEELSNSLFGSDEDVLSPNKSIRQLSDVSKIKQSNKLSKLQSLTKKNIVSEKCTSDNIASTNSSSMKENDKDRNFINGSDQSFAKGNNTPSTANRRLRKSEKQSDISTRHSGGRDHKTRGGKSSPTKAAQITLIDMFGNMEEEDELPPRKHAKKMHDKCISSKQESSESHDDMDTADRSRSNVGHEDASSELKKSTLPKLLHKSSLVHSMPTHQAKPSNSTNDANSGNLFLNDEKHNFSIIRKNVQIQKVITEDKTCESPIYQSRIKRTSHYKKVEISKSGTSVYSGDSKIKDSYAGIKLEVIKTDKSKHNSYKISSDSQKQSSTSVHEQFKTPRHGNGSSSSKRSGHSSRSSRKDTGDGPTIKSNGCVTNNPKLNLKCINPISNISVSAVSPLGNKPQAQPSHNSSIIIKKGHNKKLYNGVPKDNSLCLKEDIEKSSITDANNEVKVTVDISTYQREESGKSGVKSTSVPVVAKKSVLAGVVESTTVPVVAKKSVLAGVVESTSVPVVAKKSVLAGVVESTSVPVVAKKSVLAGVVVQALMPHYKLGVVTSKGLFKLLAKHLTSRLLTVPAVTCHSNRDEAVQRWVAELLGNKLAPLNSEQEILDLLAAK